MTTEATNWRQECLAFIDTNFAYDHLPEGPLRDSSKTVYEQALRTVELGTANRMLYTALSYLLLYKDAFVRSHLPGQQ